MSSKGAVEKLVLVDESDRSIGVEEKLAAHREGGRLHRAFSIFLYNGRGEMLLQKRSARKYHFRGLWANACCGHPRPTEGLGEAARRRLREELGIDAELHHSFSFLYTAEDAESGLTERELDHVFVGTFDGVPQPHPDEIDAVRWASPAMLERDLEGRPHRYAPWFREALARMSELAPPEPAGARPRRRRSPLRWIVALLLLVFLATIAMREPWRGHLARGDQFVTGQALRWLRTWHREGAWATSFALVLTPPTDEFQGEDRLLKWALPGHLMLVHGALQLGGLEPTVDRLMGVNLAIHLVLALLLALLAYYLARLAHPDRPRWIALTALHCGLFALLFPPILYWGQHLSCQYFTVLPLLVVVVGGRWLRASIASERRQRDIDLAVAAAVFLGTITDFLFWVLVPYLALVRGLRARKGRPRTADPWRRTLLRPYAAAMAFLFVVFLLTGQLGAMVGRAMAWTIGTDGGGPLFFLATRVWFSFEFLFGHFYDAFLLLGFVCAGLTLWLVASRRLRAELPWTARGVLLDLLLPGMLFTFLLSPHQTAHAFSPMQYVPFVALAWTFLVPWTLERARRGWVRRPAIGIYAVVAFLLLWPGSSGYRQYFPEPEPEWTLEASFLKEHTLPSDVLVSPTTEIDILPPQRIALTERAVHQVYGPLDVLRQISDLDDDDVLAVYGPRELFAPLGAGRSRVVYGGGRALTRVSVGRVRKLLNERPDAAYRAQLVEVLRGGLEPDDEALRPHEGPLPEPARPLAFHLSYSAGAGAGYEALYWKDDRHFHSARGFEETVARGEESYREAFLGMWTPADGRDERAAELGTFLLSAFDDARAAEARRFGWRGYEVVRVALGPGPAALRERAPSVARWSAYLVYDEAVPVALVLGPEGGGSAWISVSFDEVLIEIGSAFEVFEQWRIIKRPEAS